MSKNIIEFSCPSCQTELRVATELAGVKGPCPSCSNTITAPHSPQQRPQEQQQTSTPSGFGQAMASAPIRATGGPIPSSRQQGSHPHRHIPNPSANPRPVTSGKTQSQESPSVKAAVLAPIKRRIWPVIVFPLLFIILLGIVIYLVMDLLKLPIKEPIDNTPLAPNENLITSPTSPSASEPSPQEEPNRALDHDKLGEVPAGLPEVAQKNAKEIKREEILNKHRTFISQSSAILDRFLKAKSYEERRPYLTSSYRTEEQLLASGLNKPMPRKLFAELRQMRADPEVLTLETYFQVTLAAPEGAPLHEHRSIFVRMVSFSEDEPPRVHTDPFIDIYDNLPTVFAQNPEASPLTLRTVVEVSTLCFDDSVPNQHKKGVITFLPNVQRVKNTLLKAYLGKETELFQRLKKQLEPGTQRPVTLTIQWNKTEDPKKPFIEVAHLDGIGWTF